jgi:hypothetical protein
VWRRQRLPAEVEGVLSDDEKPGIQAIDNTVLACPSLRYLEHPAIAMPLLLVCG